MHGFEKKKKYVHQSVSSKYIEDVRVSNFFAEPRNTKLDLGYQLRFRLILKQACHVRMGWVKGIKTGAAMNLVIKVAISLQRSR